MIFNLSTLKFYLFFFIYFEFKWFIYINIYLNRPPLWSSGQSFWLQIQRSRVRFPALLDFLSSSGLERGPLSFVRSIEELLEFKKKVAVPVQKTEINGRGDPLR